ncbi:MAG: chorismate synthase [Eubacteriales bacterium]|nr:chorismate synthase [Eubacteriales bacterium]
MGNTIGTLFRFTIWGQSHSAQIGVTIEGIPAGTSIDLDRLQAFLDRRRPGRDRFSTPRSEADAPEFVAGLLPPVISGCADSFPGSRDPVCRPEETAETGIPGHPDPALHASHPVCRPEEAAKTGITCGAPLTAVIHNKNTRSSDYAELQYVPRPGHADYTAMVKYGVARDYAGGGQFSGRLTAPLCIAGGIALQILEKRGIRIAARPVMIGGETEKARMFEAIDRAREAGDSVGGIVECIVEGVPAGVGEPMFDGIENRIAQMVFGIPAVKGIEFGAGFAVAGMRGSENNDPFYFTGCETDRTQNVSAENASQTDCSARNASAQNASPADCTVRNASAESAFPADCSARNLTAQNPSARNSKSAAGESILSCVRTASNHHGGALGGISSGMPIVFRAAFKPTPSISREQDSVDIRTGEAVRLKIKGRHDPCIVLRAVPVVEAAAAAAVYDLLLQAGLA